MRQFPAVEEQAGVADQRVSRVALGATYRIDVLLRAAG